MILPANVSIKNRMAALKLTSRHIGALLTEKPEIVRARINGYSTLPADQERKINKYLDTLERKVADGNR